ncbi:helix-turn-helix transcriptional regulator [Brachybacterium vulturis]|uniref:helix-turn-helix transcriptional regulator n=1 Tax=Brachybacterium vulturis TaxID=2017484 RepID=UPI0037358545
MENFRTGPDAQNGPPPRRGAAGRRHSRAREQVLRTVEAQRSPVSVAAISRATGLHENTVRGHLDQLLADGHVTRSRAAAEGRGRPAWLWRPTRYGPASPYAALAGVLAGTIARTSADPAATAHEAGRGWGGQLAADLPETAPPATARAVVTDAMAAQGFAPEDDGERIVLHRCPLLEAASRHTEVVCSVHRGLLAGLLEGAPALDGARPEVELLPFAAPGQCHLRLRDAG